MRRAYNILDIHLAEYNALTQRSTYWITLQFAVWPTLLLFLTLIGQLWTAPDHRFTHTMLTWVAMLVGQVIVITYCIASWEIYNNVRYLQRDLKPLIKQHIQGHERFWIYEEDLANRRGFWMDVQDAAPAFLSVALAISLWFLVPFGTVTERVVAAVSLGLEIAICWLARRAIRMRRAIVKP